MCTHFRKHERNSRNSSGPCFQTWMQQSENRRSRKSTRITVVRSIVPNFNFVKLFAEFQIFCVLLICIVLQMGAIGLEHERIGAESYGLSLVIVTAAIIPISLVFIISSLHDIYLENKQGESTFDTFENELASK